MIEHDITVYNKSNLYEFDNSIMIHYYPKRIIEILEEYDDNMNKECLELGVGHGYSTEIFSKYFKEYTVIDGDKEVIKRYDKMHPHNTVKMINAYFEEYVPEKKYDVIILGFVLEHVDNPTGILKKYKEYLKPNGKMFITVPNAETLNRRVGKIAGLLERLEELSEHDLRCGHKRYYTVKTLKADIETCDFKISRIEGIYLKPLTTRQMISLGLSDQIIDGFLNVGREYPELSLGILVEAR